MPRFVLLRHDCPPEYERSSHWDLMLEAGDVLRTWSLVELPGAGNESVDAEELPDHRLAYLEYEGPVSGGRGTVSRTDEGTFETIAKSDDCWQVNLNGQRLCGRFTLRRSASQYWRLTAEPDT